MLHRFPVLSLCVLSGIGVVTGLVLLLRGHWLLALAAYALTVAVLIGVVLRLARRRPPGG